MRASFGPLCRAMRIPHRGLSAIFQQRFRRHLCSGESLVKSDVPSFLDRCIHPLHLKQIHAYLITNGLGRTQFLIFKLIRFCTLTLSNLSYARWIFDGLENPNAYIWTAMISAYAQHSHAPDRRVAFLLYTRMHRKGIHPNHFTFPYVLKSCVEVSSVFHAKQTHTHVLKSGFLGYTVVQTALVDAYSKCGEIEVARQLFDEMPERNVVSWTAMVYGYTRFGRMGAAVLLFDDMPVRDLPSWNAMIAGFAQNGMFGDAVSMFRRMVVEGYRPNETTMVCTLSACGHLGTLQIGNWVHGFVHKSGIGISCFVGNALIDMYGKCGSLKEARRVFDSLSERSIASWNSLINGLALHGCSDDSLTVFREMVKTGANPDEITFVGVLNACVHGGLVDEGWELFSSINRDYGIELQIQHYGCIVDLLGRAGRLNEAMEVIMNMEIEPDEVVWGALLNGCRIHGNRKLAERSATQLLDLDPQNPAYLLLLANIYSECGRWEDVGKTRKMIQERRVLKTPGCSWIEVENVVREFYSADRQHPQSEEICEALESLFLLSKDLGYSINMNCDQT